MKRNNLWAPWRIKYIKGLTDKSDDFIREYVENPQDDEQNFVLWRTHRCIVMFNRFPYNNGHLLIAPMRKISDIELATDDELLELMKLIKQAKQVLSAAINPHGFNIGINIGRCAGAGVPDHVHIHVVPRWDGDTNFMHVCSETDVISQGMRELWQQLKRISEEKKLPDV